MSELKEHQFCECDECIREYRGPLSNEMRPYYLKSEADKVIAHHKYKRCLDKAEICRQEWCTLYYERKKYRENPFLDHLMSRKNRHKEKWLKLAEKFKEAK